MKRYLIFAILLLLSGCAGTYQGVKSDYRAAVEPAPAAVDPPQVRTLLDKLVNVDGPAAIARAQREASNPKTPPAEVVYAQKRIVCYQTIIEIAPNFSLLNFSAPGESAGVLDTFEILAETAESVATVQVGLPEVDKAKFDTACGWIGQRTVNIAAALGLRLAKVAAGAAVLVPK
jgi:hypothetical protein